MLHLFPGESAALDEFCAQVRGMFGPRLRELALFGSRARAEGDEDSDLDVLVVSAEHMARLRSRERAIASEIARDAVPL